jgi:hypothetical protein
MNRLPRRFTALAILAFGASVAWLFRDPAPPVEPNPKPAPFTGEQVAWQSQEFTLDESDSAEVSPARSLYLEGNSSEESEMQDVAPLPTVRPAMLENVKPPPQLPSSYERVADNRRPESPAFQRGVLGIPTADPPSGMVAVDPPEAPSGPSSAANEDWQVVAPRVPLSPAQPAGGASKSPEPSTSVVRHRIVDGDSLEKLAARYLGDRARWPEIFRRNALKLSHPEILPIGVEIEIPRDR